MNCVYIIKSTNHNYYYVGSTQNFEKRLGQHNNKQVRSTAFYTPFFLFYKEEYSTIHEARLREKTIKKNRSLKEDIIKKALSSIG